MKRFIRLDTLFNENWLWVSNVYTGPIFPKVVVKALRSPVIKKPMSLYLIQRFSYVSDHRTLLAKHLLISHGNSVGINRNSWNCLEGITSTYWWIWIDYLKQNYWSHIWDKTWSCLSGLSGLFLDLCKCVCMCLYILHINMHFNCEVRRWRGRKGKNIPSYEKKRKKQSMSWGRSESL